MEGNKIINIGDYIDKDLQSLTGRDSGNRLLEKLKKNNIVLSKLEEKYSTITIKFPDKIIALNESFFLGFLETRVQVYKTKEAFLKKYIFDINEDIKDDIEKSFIFSALRVKSVTTS